MTVEQAKDRARQLGIEARRRREAALDQARQNAQHRAEAQSYRRFER